MGKRDIRGILAFLCCSCLEPCKFWLSTSGKHLIRSPHIWILPVGVYSRVCDFLKLPYVENHSATATASFVPCALVTVAIWRDTVQIFPTLLAVTPLTDRSLTRAWTLYIYTARPGGIVFAMMQASIFHHEVHEEVFAHEPETMKSMQCARNRLVEHSPSKSRSRAN